MFASSESGSASLRSSLGLKVLSFVAPERTIWLLPSSPGSSFYQFWPDISGIVSRLGDLCPASSRTFGIPESRCHPILCTTIPVPPVLKSPVRLVNIVWE